MPELTKHMYARDVDGNAYWIDDSGDLIWAPISSKGGYDDDLAMRVADYDRPLNLNELNEIFLSLGVIGLWRGLLGGNPIEIDLGNRISENLTKEVDELIELYGGFAKVFVYRSNTAIAVDKDGKYHLLVENIEDQSDDINSLEKTLAQWLEPDLYAVSKNMYLATEKF